MKKEEKIELQNNAKRISKFFKIEITLSIFDHILIHWVWPPQNDEQ